MVFFDKRANNEELLEITDEKIIKRVKENLNLENDSDPVTPLICGTIVNGSFKRKLKMLRADVFAMLSVCQNEHIITEWNQSKAIKRGAFMFCSRTQDISMEDIVSKMKGWEAPLLDKALNNASTDV